MPWEITMPGTLSAPLHSPLPGFLQQGGGTVQLCDSTALAACWAQQTAFVTLGHRVGYRFILQFRPGFTNLGDMVISSRKQGSVCWAVLERTALL